MLKYVGIAAVGACLVALAMPRAMTYTVDYRAEIENCIRTNTAASDYCQSLFPAWMERDGRQVVAKELASIFRDVMTDAFKDAFPGLRVGKE